MADFAPQDILELTLDNNQIEIKSIQFHPQPKIISHNISFNDSLYNDIVNRVQRISYSESSFLEELKKLGQLIYKLFFYDSNGQLLKGMSTVFQNNNPLNLFLNGKIEIIPLELAYDGEKYAGLKRIISRSNSEEGVLNKKRELVKTEKSLLVIADPTQNSDASYHEGEILFNKLNENHSKYFSTIDFLSKEMSKIEFTELLEHYDYLYFAGHGELSRELSGSLRLGKNVLLEEKDISILQNPPEMIFINACLTSLVDPTTQSSLIKKLLKVGVKNIIASSWIIFDEDFSQFSLKFFDQLFSGQSIGESFNRVKLYNYDENDFKWAYFSLFGNPLENFFS